MAIETELPRNMFMGVTAAEPNWEAVYTEQLPRVYNFFRYRLGNEAHAEDLTSRTFEKAWSARARYRRDLAGFSTWLLSIARNVAVDHLRAHRAHLPLEAADEEPARETPHDQVALGSDLARLAS
jgi:RNA polymerase sigma-70 factor (ECF subfamily)